MWAGWGWGEEREEGVRTDGRGGMGGVWANWRASESACAPRLDDRLRVGRLWAVDRRGPSCLTGQLDPGASAHHPGRRPLSSGGTAGGGGWAWKAAARAVVCVGDPWRAGPMALASAGLLAGARRFLGGGVGSLPLARRSGERERSRGVQVPGFSGSAEAKR
ncbi:hypothetical protein GGTG_10331 [Gaeumannomyces tritici R3-111a-1]|uniref:Uncharacterized protein n=1 Tax=Gaeumannomyces tritici (strain R3-111a-1) TaxID=644352 RepID=J3PA07_GAET3|nr:hypothetical protein GGTG_10331 [Gaeumannomyces tritici R3-111a-1]EJT73493.1 hypothetical protein GGTG_10331 [Gaeumannomyces tritici R3-111a-1]